MIVCGITRPLGRLSPTVGQVPHVLRTRLPLNGELPPRPVRLACVRHAASVRPEPGSNSPMRIQFSSNRTTVLPVVRITSESNPSRHASRSEEHTSELQSQSNLVCRLLLEKKKN